MSRLASPSVRDNRSCNSTICDHCVKGISNLMTHSICVNIIVKPVMGHLDHIATTRFYGVLRPGRGIIDVCLRNHNTKQITLPKWTAVEEIAEANIIPALLVSKPTEHE